MTFQERLTRVKFLATDFDGVWTDNHVLVNEHGEESVSCSKDDSEGLEQLRQLGVQLAIISRESNPVVTRRGDKLRIPVFQGVKDKRATLIMLARRYGVPLEETAYIGNDVSDLEALQAAGLAIVPSGTGTGRLARRLGLPLDSPPFYWNGIYVTDHRGGDGAVREVCDLIADAKEAHKPNMQRVGEAIG